MTRNADIYQRAAWEDLTFPLSECTQTGGRAVTENEAWRRDGAELVNGGRKAFRGKMTAAFLDTIEGYGDLWPSKFEALLTRFYADAEGRLSHPLLGTFTAVVTSWEPKLSSKVQNGAFVEFEWVEQRASSVGVIALMEDRGTGDPTTELAAQAATADVALAAAGAPPSTPIAAVAATVITKTSTSLPYTKIGQALAPIDAAVELSRGALSALLVTGSNAIAVWQARAALARVLTASGRLRASLLPGPSKATVYQLTRAMTFAEISQAVYGTPFRAGYLRSANAVAADVVRAGRSLTVLP